MTKYLCNKIHSLTSSICLIFMHAVLPSSHLQPSVLEVLLAADLEGLRCTDSVEAALQMM